MIIHSHHRSSDHNPLPGSLAGVLANLPDLVDRPRAIACARHKRRRMPKCMARRIDTLYVNLASQFANHVGQSDHAYGVATTLGRAEED